MVSKKLLKHVNPHFISYATPQAQLRGYKRRFREEAPPPLETRGVVVVVVGSMLPEPHPHGSHTRAKAPHCTASRT